MTITNVLTTTAMSAALSASGAPADEAYIEVLDEGQTEEVPALMTVQDVYAHYLLDIGYADEREKHEEQDESKPEDDEDDKDEDGDKEDEADDETKAPKETDSDEDSDAVRDDVSEESDDDGRNEGQSGSEEGEETKAEESEGESEEEEDEEVDEKVVEDEEVSESNGETMTMEATAYVSTCEGCSGTTASGKDVNSSTQHGGKTVIAAPTSIPFGTEIMIETSDGEVINGVVEDRGGNITEGRLDILVSSEEEASSFGRQSVEVNY